MMDPMEAIQYLAAFLICVGILIYKLPVAVCKECPHCKAAKEAAKERKHVNDHRNTWWRCPDEKCSKNPPPYVAPVHNCGRETCPHKGEVH